MISQHWLRSWLGAIRQQAITWANIDPDLCCHMAWLGHNEFIPYMLYCCGILSFDIFIMAKILQNGWNFIIQFQMHFLEFKLMYFHWNVAEVCSQGSNWWRVSIDSGTGLGTYWQVISSNNDDLIDTLRPRHNGHHFAVIFKCIFLNRNVSISIEISLKFVPKGPISYIPALVQMMAWRWAGDKSLSEPMIDYRRIYASLGLKVLKLTDAYPHHKASMSCQYHLYPFWD